MTKRNQSLLRLVQMAILSAIIVIMGFTVLGSIPLGGPLVATMAQVPVVIGAVLLGTKCGCILGGVFGAVSCLYFTLYSYPTSFVFSPFQSVSLADNAGTAVLYAVFSLLICFVPRILIGFVSGSIFSSLGKRGKSPTLGCILAGVAGSLVNTLLVLGGIWLFYGQQYLTATGAAQPMLYLIGSTILVNGLPEAVVTPILTTAICRPLMLLKKKGKI